VLLRSAQQHRETRLYEMTSGLPLMLWAMLIVFSVTLLGFLFFFGMEVVVTQMAFTAVFAGSLAMVLVILGMLNYPFEGAMALQPNEFQQTLVHVGHLP
jgi:membrane-associated HD superfamily phosphohydrolase